MRVKGTADAVRSYYGGRVRQSKGGGDLWAQVRYVDRTAFENEVPSLFLTPAAGSSYLTDMYIQRLRNGYSSRASLHGHCLSVRRCRQRETAALGDSVTAIVLYNVK
jgi:hypothetical protein